jgi:hypothetical protein
VPSTLQTFAIERFQNSVDATPSGLSLIRCPSMTTEPPSAARSTQSFGFGMFASIRALKSCSPIDAYTSEVRFQARRSAAIPAAAGAAIPGSLRRRGVPSSATSAVATSVTTTRAFSMRPSGQAHSRFARARIDRPCAS